MNFFYSLWLRQVIALRNKKNQGFTLIEVLVVVIILGILAAVALPAFLQQANKAKQAEARTYIGSLNRAQQAYYLEAGSFATQFDQLPVGLKTSSHNYEYHIAVQPGNSGAVVHIADPKSTGTSQSPLKAYVGPVKLRILSSGDMATLTLLCEAREAPIASGDQPGDGSSLNWAEFLGAGNTAPLSCDPAKYKDLGT